MKWIQVNEKLPKINQLVLLSSVHGKVFTGYRDKPDLIWQVTDPDGKKHWVYDPESYTDDIDSLPKAEDCGFSASSNYIEGMVSVSSVNYDPKWDAVIAWQPLPKPYMLQAEGVSDESRR